MRLKLNWDFSRYVSYYLNLFLRQVIAVLTLGLAGHIAINYKWGELLEGSSLADSKVNARFKLEWGDYITKIYLPAFVAIIVILVISGIVTSGGVSSIFFNSIMSLIVGIYVSFIETQAMIAAVLLNNEADVVSNIDVID